MIGACPAMVQRAAAEALGLCEPWPGTPALIPKLEPPPVLDTAAQFADDGLIAGRQGEVLRAVSHLMTHMPLLGLRFSKMDIIPASPAQGSSSRWGASASWTATLS